MGHDVSEPEYRWGQIHERFRESVALNSRFVIGTLATLVLLMRSHLPEPFSEPCYRRLEPVMPEH